jgi:mRNA interferase MazF
VKASHARRWLARRFWKRNERTAGRGCGRRPKHCATILLMSPPRASWLPRWTPSVRGDLYRLKAAKDIQGHEQAGSRFAVVVQSDDLPLSTWIIAPTSTGRREASFRPEIEIDGTKTRVLVEQLTVIDPQARLGEYAGRLDSSEMQAVDFALRAVLALD